MEARAACLDGQLMQPIVWRIALASFFAVTTQARAGGPCEELGLPLAKTTRLKPFLEQLAEKRNLKLHYWTTEDPDVYVAGTNDVALMASLASQANLIVRYSAPGARCKTQSRINTVWVLPSGPANPARSSSAPDLSGLNDLATRAYMQAHGMLAESP